MGLNVYFCDVCGVRVTDVDLRSGHGMLRGQDVICATCLEMGHGKEWLAARGGEAVQVSAAATVQAAQAAHAKLIDHARDRAVTVPDDRADLQHGQQDADGDRQPAVREGVEVRQQDHEDTGLVDPIPAEFSGAAASFAALTNTPEDKRSATPAVDASDDIVEEVDQLLSPPTPLSPPAPPSARESSEVHEASPYVEKAPDDDDSSALVSVGKPRSPSRSAAKADAKSGSGTRKPPASSRAGKPGAVPATTKKTPSSANIPAKSASSSKVGKPKTGRSGRASAGGGMPKPVKVALVTVPLILLIAAGIIVSRGGGGLKPGEVHDLKAQQSQISKSFAEAQRMVNDAWVSKEVSQMRAADDRWRQFMLEWESFSSDAKKYSHWTDDNCSDYWEGLHAPDVSGRTRLLRDEISKQTSH